MIKDRQEGEFLVFKVRQEAWEIRQVKPVYARDTLVQTADAWAREEVDSPYPFASIDQARRLAYILGAAERSANTGRTEQVVYQN